MTTAAPAAGVVSFAEARKIVEQHAATVSPGEPEAVDLLSASGRTLAEPIAADRDFPPFPRATRDGYAIRAQDVAEVPARLELIGEIRAGDSPTPAVNVGRGQAVSIMTGAPLPSGTDAVVMVEHTAQSGSTIEIKRSVKSGENYVPRGAEARQGQMLLESGMRLDHAAIALAASVGKSRLQVFRKPRVGCLRREMKSWGLIRSRVRLRFGIQIRTRWQHKFRMRAERRSLCPLRLMSGSG